MEEDGGGAAAEDGRATEGLSERERSAAQLLEVLRHGDGLIEQGLLVGQSRPSAESGLEGLDAEEIHTVIGAGAGGDDELSFHIRRLNARAFAVDEIIGLVGDVHGNGVVEDAGILLEDGGEIAQARLPGSAVDLERPARRP